jgi:hypothetical protein
MRMWSPANPTTRDCASSFRSMPTVTASLARFNHNLEQSRLHLGGPPHDGAPWFSFEDLLSPQFADRVIRRVAEWSDATHLVASTYTFRYAIQIPLSMAGYLFAMDKRVPTLRHNIMLVNKEWLNEAALLSPRMTVLQGDKLSGEAGIQVVEAESQLADALFHETDRLIEPLLEVWAPCKLVARANAWGSALDALAYGFQMAGRDRIGLDEAWNAWNAAIEGRTFPVRRRPRRLQFECEGTPNEILVRSGCCFWYMLPESRKGGLQEYCSSCYLRSDKSRIERMVAYWRECRAQASE